MRKSARRSLKGDSADPATASGFTDRQRVNLSTSTLSLVCEQGNRGKWPKLHRKQVAVSRATSRWGRARVLMKHCSCGPSGGRLLYKRCSGPPVGSKAEYV